MSDWLVSLFVSFVLFILSSLRPPPVLRETCWVITRCITPLLRHSTHVQRHKYDLSVRREGESKAVIWVITVAGPGSSVYTKSPVRTVADKPHNYNLFPEKVKFEALLSRMSVRQIHAMTHAIFPPTNDCIYWFAINEILGPFYVGKLDKSPASCGAKIEHVMGWQ